MPSFSSMISLIVVLLAAYAYSAPIVTDFPNTTEGFQVENVTISTREESAEQSEDKRATVTVGQSSSSEEVYSNETTQTINKQSERGFEDTSIPSSSETNNKRAVDSEANELSADNEAERSFTEDTFTSETNTKRAVDSEANELSADNEAERSFTEDTFTSETNTKRAVDSEASELSADNEAERSFTEDTFTSKTNTKRGIEVESFESSTVVDETSTVEDSSIPSTSEVTNMKRGFGEFSSLTAEANQEFNRRAIGSVESVEAGESSTVIVVKIQPESTTDEQTSSSSTVESDQSTVVIDHESSSTVEYETTVVPIEESTSVSPIPRETTPKILAIIPGTVSKSQVVIQPVEQVQLSQGQNQTIFEATKPNY